jgi:hypothetical protein
MLSRMCVSLRASLRAGIVGTGVLLVLLGASTARAGTGFGVVTVSPAAESVGASTATTVDVGFSEPVDASTVGPASFRVFGRWSGVVPGLLQMLDGGLTVRFYPSRPLSPGERVSVMLSSAIESLTNQPLVGGHAFSFWARSGPVAANFGPAGQIDLKQPLEGHVQPYGVYAGDLDGDGACDFTIPNESASDVRVLMNDGCGSYAGFVVYPLASTAVPSANEGQDFDGDGDIDFATGNIGDGSLGIMLGDGQGGFSPPMTYAGGAQPRGLAVLDVEGDGDVDVVLGNRSSSDVALFRNNGDGSFAPATFFEGGGAGETAIAAADGNGDGWPDLFVAHYNSGTVSLLLGDGSGGFALSDTVVAGAGPWNLVAGDIDGDGHVDVVCCNSGSADVSVLLGDGLGGLELALTLPVGAFPIAVDLGDLDGDGDLDLVASCFGGNDWEWFLNDGSGGMSAQPPLPSISSGSCCVLVDSNRDGLLDIVGVDETADRLLIWEHRQALAIGMQQRSCSATLRINNMAYGAGFGFPPAEEVPLGSLLYLSVTAEPGKAFLMLVGVGTLPGIPTLYGALNILPPLNIPVVGVVNGKGEALLGSLLPMTGPTGIEVTLQALVQTGGGGLVLSNPETIVAVP